MRQFTRVVLRLQLDEGVGHAVELERSQLVESGMRKHCCCSPELSVDVTRPTDVVVVYPRLVRGRCEPLAIAVGLQDRVDRAVGSCGDLQLPAAGCPPSLCPAALFE